MLDLSEENRQLKAKLLALEKELVQERTERLRYQRAYIDLKMEHATTKEDERDRKRKCMQLSGEITNAMNRYSREPTSSKAQRYGDQLQRLQNNLNDLAN